MTQFELFTANEIRPAGWMKTTLRTEADGLAGNLDKIWPDVRDSKWIGGEREGWERVPYWLDGFIPLAWLLDDGDMKARARRYIDAILASQCEDGWICPCPVEERKKYDAWALLLLSKVLTLYYECSGDVRIPDVLYRALHNYYEMLRDGTAALFNWGKARWYEGFIALDMLRRKYGEPWITELAIILQKQGTDYEKLTDMWRRPLNKWTQQTHIVNLMMMLKSEALVSRVTGEAQNGLAKRLYDILYKYNGTPVGVFTGDECLSGISPIQGTELCAVVEEMYSLELLYAFTGDTKWAEILERVAFNALPAAITDDMWAHQYVQMSNQPDCTKMPGKSIFRTNGPAAHTFGLEPHFGCCTANFGQGWPKLMLSSFMRCDGGILCAVPVPGEVHTEQDSVPVTVSLETDYPFKNRFVYRIKAERPVRMKLMLRIPSFAGKVMLDNKARCRKDYITVDRVWRAESEVTLEYAVTPHLEATPAGLYCAVAGSLVFSLPLHADYRKVEYESNGVKRQYPYCDWEVSSTDEWAFAFADSTIVRKEQETPDNRPFSSLSPGVTLEAKLCPVEWGLLDGYEKICAKLPQSRRATGAARTVSLYPYGCAKLRMTELPRAIKLK